MKEVRLSARRLGEAVSAAEQEKQFTFIVGKEAKEYTCSLVQACFISGKVCRLVSNDSTINVLRVLPDEQCNVFELIEHLWNGRCINISKDNAGCLSNLSSDLENEELNSVLVDFGLSNEEISVENCFSRLRLKSKLGLNCDEELEFGASNFFEFKDLTSLSVNELENILVRESLQIESENSLFDSIVKLVSRDESYSVLFKYIQFEYLDSGHIDMFFKAVYPEHIDDVLWESITKFITNSVKNAPPNPRNNKRLHRKNVFRVFEYNSSLPLSGIISDLRTECGGNPHEKGTVNITASSSSRNKCHQIVDYGWGNHWHTSDSPNQWIQFDFKDLEVSLESYTIKSNLNGNSCHYMRQWKIEGSNDASSWMELDSRYTTDLNSSSVTKHFTCSQQKPETFFRYIRLTQTGTNGGGHNYLMLSEIEFFGKIA